MTTKIICEVCDQELKVDQFNGWWHRTQDHWFYINALNQEECEIYKDNMVLCFQKDHTEIDSFYYLAILDETGLSDLYPLNDQNKYWSIKTWIEFFENNEILK